MKLTVIGTGYVGLSIATLLSTRHDVVAFDIDKDKVNKINNRISPIKDKELVKILCHSDISLTATNIKDVAYLDAELIIICTPTNYDFDTNEFDTSTVEKTIRDSIKINNKLSIFIKSTVPVGFTEKMRTKFNKEDIYFSPEFLREGKSVYDNQHPSRIIVGGESEKARDFSKILLDIARDNKEEPPVILMNSNEAEAVKLFSNTYLAMRIAFFNELDSYCEFNMLDTRSVIKGTSFDPRIGDYYNNPSFGYGGYCLPKDTQQLLKNYEKVPNNIIRAIVDANSTRKEFIANQIIAKKPKVVGIYRLVMKEGSDNFRESAVQGIMKRIKAKGIKIIIFEPEFKEKTFYNSYVLEDLEDFFNQSDIIIANRKSSDLDKVTHKVYSRDLFREN
tara:strand:- start:864 stop:2036 length:1173 start_codon:yes stop_codon:yes gene_type:complete